jgi:hypothetical protein
MYRHMIDGRTKLQLTFEVKLVWLWSVVSWHIIFREIISCRHSNETSSLIYTGNFWTI